MTNTPKEERKLVIGFAYLIDCKIRQNADFGDAVPNDVASGYYVGSITESPGGSFRDIGSLVSSCAEAAAASKAWNVPVDMNFEGLIKTKTMTLLLQPIQNVRATYKSVKELADTYLTQMQKQPK